MKHNGSDELVKLSDTSETIELGDKDLRGYSVKDKHGADLGKVHDLLIDLHENKVRFLVVASGGFLGVGENKLFIPVDAISGLTENEVHIDHTREKVDGAPPYDPSLVNDRQYHENIYRHFGYDPYWAGGYVYPRTLSKM